MRMASWLYSARLFVNVYYIYIHTYVYSKHTYVYMCSKERTRRQATSFERWSMTDGRHGQLWLWTSTPIDSSMISSEPRMRETMNVGDNDDTMTRFFILVEGSSFESIRRASSYVTRTLTRAFFFFSSFYESSLFHCLRWVIGIIYEELFMRRSNTVCWG